jgi:hypothetical protein
MDKNKLINRIENIGFLLGCFIGLLTLMMLGAEPTTWDEDGLYDYEHLWDKGNSGWYVMWTWVWSVVTLIGLIVVRSFIKKSLTK